MEELRKPVGVIAVIQERFVLDESVPGSVAVSLKT